MQMSFYFMNECNLIGKLKMGKLDQMCMLIAASCHDLGHDGLTNSYHMSAITKRAIDSNDHSV